MVKQKSKQTTIEDRTEPMSSPINNPAYCSELFLFSAIHNIWGGLELHFKEKNVIYSK